MKPEANHNITPDQRFVFDELIEMLALMRAVDQGKELEVGDATDMAVALGRAQRLSTHLSHLSDELTYPSTLREATEIFTQHEEWREVALLETHFNDMVVAFTHALKDPDSSSLELMRLMIEVDRLICALSVLNRGQEDELSDSMIHQLSVVTTVALEGTAKFSDRAQNFIHNQGPRGAWRAVWEQISRAGQRLEELQELMSDLEHIDEARPLPSLDFFSGLDESLDTSIDDFWSIVRDFRDRLSFEVTSLEHTYLTQAAASEGTWTREIIDDVALGREEYEGTVFEYFVTCDQEGNLTFHVEASKPTSMRLKVNDQIIHARDEGLSLELQITQSVDQQVIEHYVKDVLVRSWP